MFFLLLLLHCFIFILVLLLCCVYRSSLYCNISSYLCTLCLSCYYFYIVLSLYLYCCYVMHTDHHFTVIYLQFVYPAFALLLLLHCFILYLYSCYVMYADHHLTVIYLQMCVLCVCLVITSTLFYLYTCIVVCFVSQSSLYCNIPSDLCTLCMSCYYFYIVLSLLLYCCYVVYPDHHFTVIYHLQTCVLCVCLVIISTLFYLDNCTVAMLCI